MLSLIFIGPGDEPAPAIGCQVICSVLDGSLPLEYAKTVRAFFVHFGAAWLVLAIISSNEIISEFCVSCME